MSIVKPILRMFDYEKTVDFYVNWLGFTIDWEHVFEPGMPIYMQVTMGDIVLHLSEHHGDGTPGSRVFIENFENIVAYQKQLIEKQYKYNRPGIERAFWDPEVWTVEVIDPSGNKIIFNGK